MREADYSHFSVIIGSSSEGLPVAREIRRCLRDQYGSSLGLVKVWDQENIFEGGSIYLESLEKALKEFDFAILVFTGDDDINVRGKNYFQARDNVIFELGLFIGSLGRERTFIFRSNDINLKMPTDLDGLTTFIFDKSRVDINDPGFSRECEKLGAAIINRSKQDFTNRNKYFVLFPSLRDDTSYLQLLSGISSNPPPNRDMTFVAPNQAYSGQQFLDLLDNLLKQQQQYAGGIIAATLEGIETKNLTNLIDQFEIPIVLVDINPYREGPLPKTVRYVGFDNRGGGRLAALEMTRALGPNLENTHVLILGNEDQRDRHEGFIESWTGKIPPDFEKCRFNIKEAREIAHKKLRHSDICYDGIFCVSDEIALGALQAVRDRELKTVIIGFDGYPSTTILIDLKDINLINTVVQDSYELGERAIRLLKKMMEKVETEEQIEIVSARLYI